MKQRIKMLMWTVVLALSGVTGWGATIYVADSGGNDGNSGVDWANALKTISNGVAQAGSGGEVIVSNGTYTVTTNVIMGNVTVRSQNGRDVTFVNGNYPATTNRCFYLNNAGAVLQGFTISNGADVGAGVLGGGAVFITNGGTVSACVITNNRAVSASGFGGGIAVWVQGVVSNCIIAGNTANIAGGGVYMKADAGAMSLLNCTVSGNQATNGSASGGAGGVMLSATKNALIKDCTILNNSGTYMGGGIGQVTTAAGGTNMVQGGTISGNSSKYYGGGIYADTTFQVIGCTISNNNIQTAGFHGGGVYGAGLIRACTIVENHTAGTGSAGLGGGVYLGSAGQILDSTLANNWCGDGGLTDGGGGARTANGGIVSNCSRSFNSMFACLSIRGTA